MATTQKSQTGQEKTSGQGSNGKSNSGNFANMDDGKQKEMASKGGKNSHSGSRSH
jgi:hypothetical protein